MTFFKKSWSPKQDKMNYDNDKESVMLVGVSKKKSLSKLTEYLEQHSISPAYMVNLLDENDGSLKRNSNFNNFIDKDEPLNKSRKNAKISNISLISRKTSSAIHLSDLNLERRCRSKSVFMVPFLRVAPWVNTICKNRNTRSASLESGMVEIRSDSEFIPKRIRSAVSVYVLDHLMTSKRIELLENMYGGKYKAHKAATVIQRYFRNYRAKKITKKICSPYTRKYTTASKSLDNKRNECKEENDGTHTPRQQKYQYDPNDPFRLKDDEERQRIFCLGIRIFNRNSNKGINFLIRHNIVDADESSIVKFFETKGLSSYAKGDYMSQDNNKLASSTRREYINRLSFHNCSIEKGVRKLFSHIRVPGETQKILNMVEEFNGVYLSHNIEFRDKLQNPDTVVMIAFAILMLHTSLFNPSARKQDRMSKEDFTRIFRDFTKDPVIPENYFDEIYDSVKRQQMKPLSDHTDLVRNIFSQLVGPKVPKDLVQNYRKLVCHYQLKEIPNVMKKPNSHIHNRETFLFNDLILITKKTQNCNYSVKMEIPLFGICILEFNTKYYPYGVELRTFGGRKALIFLDCINEEIRKKFINEINVNVEELNEIDKLRVEEEMEKIYPEISK